MIAENGVPFQLTANRIKAAINTPYTKIETDKTLSEEILEFLSPSDVITKHLVIKKQSSEGIYYVFRFLDGKSVMNWGPMDYEIAEEQIYIGTIPIVMELPEEHSMKFVNIPDSYRTSHRSQDE